MNDQKAGKILFICTGNTCRSPMAERLVKHALSAQDPPLNQLEVASAGIAAGNGYPPSSNSVAALKKVGLDLNDHITTQATKDLIKEADFVFGMTSSHIEAVRYLLDDQSDQQLFLMREFIEGNADKEIPDPFGQGFSDYEYARDSMVEAIPGLLQFLKSQYSNPS